MIELGGRDTKKAMIPIYGNTDQDKILLNPWSRISIYSSKTEIILKKTRREVKRMTYIFLNTHNKRKLTVIK